MSTPPSSGPPPRVLITGIAGFCGSHLAERLLAQDHAVFGLEPEGVPEPDLNGGDRRLTMMHADLRRVEQLRRVVRAVKPDHVYHLAGRLKSGSLEAIEEMVGVNVQGTINLMEVLLTEVPDCALLMVGSSAQYGLVEPSENPIRETQPFRPVTHYAVTKAAQDLLGFSYGSTTTMRIVRTRAFNIVGPRQSPSFVAPAFAKQIAEIELCGQPPVITVGNLEAQRDFVDVRDVARAYQLALARGRSGEVYNVCSGRGRSVRSLLEGLLTLSRREIEIRPDPARLQPADVPSQIGSFDKLRAEIGWEPEVSFEQSLADLLDDWRAQVSRRP